MTAFCTVNSRDGGCLCKVQRHEVCPIVPEGKVEQRESSNRHAEDLGLLFCHRASLPPNHDLERDPSTSRYNSIGLGALW